MATEQDIIRAVQNRRRLQRDNVLRKVGSAPGTFAAGVREGPSAAAAYAESWRQQPRAKVDKMAVAKAKADLINKMVDLEAAKYGAAGARDTAKGAYRQELAKQDVELFKALLVSAGTDATVAGNVASAYNSARASVGNNTADNYITAITGVLGQAGGQAAATAWDQATTAGISPDAQDTAGGWANPETSTALASALRKTDGDPATQKAILSAYDAATRNATGGMGIREVMNTGLIPDASAADADYILAKFAENETELAQIVQGSQNLQAAQEEAVARDLLKGVRGINVDAVIANFKAAKAAMLEGDADGVEDAIDDTAAKASAHPPGSPQALESTKKLLDDLTDIENNPNAPQTAREAKQDILNSDWFQDWKKINNLPDDQEAFKALNRWVTGKVQENKMVSAASLRNAGGVAGLKAPSQPTAVAHSPAAGSGPAGEIVLDDEFGAHRVDGFGNLQPLDDAEYDAWLDTMESEGAANAAIAKAQQAFKSIKSPTTAAAPAPAEQPIDLPAPPVVTVTPNRKTAAQIAQSVLGKKRKLPVGV